ncbi:hypothetical protein [Anaeromicropila herbilytica]|uniref:Uncharacterized protein n=1 Tax=Anaeromicropila herbilytica TaxID=2785025 RepID=A0A7R7ENF0_9FIRM|nr:hypothetical protein [Anaeromicropila herbilytica]BCN31801.1 hypothetical protein bsdtb5_30960 [Anaeromicropila herbilytica]
MAKPNRGASIKSKENWRGTCPCCKRTRVKLLWTKVTENKEKLTVCKHCGNK